MEMERDIDHPSFTCPTLLKYVGTLWAFCEFELSVNCDCDSGPGIQNTAVQLYRGMYPSYGDECTCLSHRVVKTVSASVHSDSVRDSILHLKRLPPARHPAGAHFLLRVFSGAGRGALT